MSNSQILIVVVIVAAFAVSYNLYQTRKQAEALSKQIKPVTSIASFLQRLF